MALGLGACPTFSAGAGHGDWGRLVAGVAYGYGMVELHAAGGAFG